jgi:hypothetical protein
MGAPRPSAGGFYLEPEGSLAREVDDDGLLRDTIDSLVADGLARKAEPPSRKDGRKDGRKNDSHDGLHGPVAPSDQLPLTHWGSADDLGSAGPRRIAGRCFYWHGWVPGDDERPYPRHESRRDGQSQAPDTQGRDGHVVGPPLTLESRITFEGLTPAELGSLLAAVQPGLVLHDVDSGHRAEDGSPVVAGRAFATHLGGGKGLGLGSVRATVVEGSLHLDDACSRYAGGPRPRLTVADLIAAFRPFTDPERAPVTWRALASVLAEGRVPADRIWYPPGLPWSKRVRSKRIRSQRVRSGGREFDPQFDRSFDFFAKHRGGGIGARKDLGLLPLPSALDPVQLLPILGDEIPVTKRERR